MSDIQKPVDLSALIAESVELERKATPGPWHDTLCTGTKAEVHMIYDPRSSCVATVTDHEIVARECDPNAAFIAHARTALPALCRALSASLKVVEAARALKNTKFFGGTIDSWSQRNNLYNALSAFDRISEGEPER